MARVIPDARASAPVSPLPMKNVSSCLFSLAALGAATALHGAVVSANFNDLALGDPRGKQKNQQPADTGRGFGAPYWATDTGVPRIVAGDLAAPAATGYGLAQSGNPRSYQAPAYKLDDATDRRQCRPLAQKLTGTVWISFLVKNADANQAAGIDFNGRPQIANSVVGTRIVVEGGTVRVFNAGNVKAGEAIDAVPLGQAALILVRLDIGAAPNGKNDKLQLWVNPQLTANPADLPKPAFALGNTGFIGSTLAIATLGLQSYDLRTGAGQVGGILDAVTLADGEGAYAAVTGLGTP